MPPPRRLPLSFLICINILVGAFEDEFDGTMRERGGRVRRGRKAGHDELDVEAWTLNLQIQKCRS